MTAAELFFAVARLGVLFSMNLSLQFVEQIPQLLILTTIFQLVMNTLAYIAIGGYWTERLSLAGLQATEENQKVKSLLKEREELITSLLRANKTSVTGALSASIAHELNQPLGATNLNIQFLQKKLLAGELNPRLQSDILESLLADNERASKIIQSLRSIFSEEEASTEVIDLNEVIQSTISICKSELAFRKIQMVLSLEPSLKVKAGAGEMQQVILNLLNNAMQALEHVSMDNKQITIEGKHTPEGIRLCISDNGTGVPIENQPYLFDLLVGTKKTGMGLGLWLCKHIVSRYDGQIYYEEVASGGARFALSLPNK